MKKIITALALTMVAGTAMAVEPVVVDSATKLDIKQVISTTADYKGIPDYCGMTQETITYLDSKGVLSQTTYKVQGNGCNG